MYDIQYYVDAAGKPVITAWLDQLRDKRARAKIAARIGRLAHGNFGDSKAIRGGINELRIHAGPGYRVYYSIIGKVCILLLCAGDKRKQARDIERAIDYLKDFQSRES